MHFDQATMREIADKATNLNRLRAQVDAAQKMGAEWDHIQKLNAQLDAAQNEMNQVGIRAAMSLPRSIKDEAKGAAA